MDHLIFEYDASGAPTGFHYNGAHFFYLTNQMGDVIGIADASGNPIAFYHYDEWGSLLSIITATEGNATQLAIANANPLRYRGYYYDTETGYYYLQSRYYDPSICRFINADILVGKIADYGTNLFTYCNNNPIANIDLLGCISVSKEASWLIDVLFSSIMALKLSGPALAAKVSTMIISIAPYLFWVAVAVTAAVITYFVVRNAVVSKAHS